MYRTSVPEQSLEVLWSRMLQKSSMRQNSFAQIFASRVNIYRRRLGDPMQAKPGGHNAACEHLTPKLVGSAFRNAVGKVEKYE
jgi:hypothetical protein